MFVCKLKAILEERGSSMLQLSREMGVPYSQISDFASLRRSCVNLKLWGRIGNHLGVDPTKLIVWVNTE